jgi:hypothetical protein
MPVGQAFLAGFKTVAAIAEISGHYDPQLFHPPQSSIQSGPAEPGIDHPGPVVNLFARWMMGFQCPEGRPDGLSLPGIFQPPLAEEMPQIVLLKKILILKIHRG